MEDRQTKPRRRLKVFEQMSKTPSSTFSRTLEINRVPNPEYLSSYLRRFGELKSFNCSESGRVEASFFDIRDAIQAKTQLSMQFAADYMADEEEDCLCIPNSESWKLEQYQESFMKVFDSGSVQQVRFYDIRALRQILSMREEEFFVENQFHDNPLPLPSDMNQSINSDSTSPSPYIPSEERKKPKKKPVNEKDKRLFVINLEKIKHGVDQRTTVMIRNIPNKYTQKMLLEKIDKEFPFSYDFFYLPIDFNVSFRQNKCNVGYAFINFVDFRVILRFYREFNNKKWERFNSDKICALAYARIQGTSSLVQHFQRSSVMNQLDANVRPLYFPHTPNF